jgi:hypothetical protein
MVRSGRQEITSVLFSCPGRLNAKLNLVNGLAELMIEEIKYHQSAEMALACGCRSPSAALFGTDKPD